jgi:DNA repair exonuclease SbcCD ATPase subunit
MIRASDSELRERALAQLSGGQWRRVSMALDLAFAEAIRRKGTLRSNLIVMDEILTHLDAMGREAVGYFHDSNILIVYIILKDM